MTLTEKVAYLKGLMEGLNVGKDTAEGKVLCAMADILDDLATSVVDLEDSMAEAQGYLDELDDDLADVEDIIYEDEDEDDYYDDDEDDDEDYIDEDDFIEVECPYCGETVYFDDSVDPDDIICPASNESFSCICDECDGDCCDCDEDCCEDCDACDSCEDLKALDGEDDE